MVEYLFRRNVVLEALRGQRRRRHRLYVQQGLDPRLLDPILALARQQNVPVSVTDKQALGQLAQDGSHQGVVLAVDPFVYSDLEGMLTRARARAEPPLLLALDLLHGPQNIGALLRTAEICGVHGVIMQDRRAPEITPAVVQYAAGATEHLLVAQVTNLVRTLGQLQAADVWVAGLDTGADAYPLGQIDLDRPLALVVGHEGQGLRRLVRDSCDFILALPMRGHVESLNAAVAGSIALMAAWQARGFPGARRPPDKPSDQD